MLKLTLNKKGKILEITIAIVFILIGVSLRLLPHPFNFTPIAAIALFGGVYFSRKLALFLPIAVMAISDIFIGSYEIKLMVFVYGSFLLCVILGFWLKKNKKWYTVLGSALLGALIFFFLTNFAVWIFTSWYPKTIVGLVQSYLMALPFFRNTILGNLFYVSVFFGAYELVKLWIKETTFKPFLMPDKLS
ncbi:MAG TPA: hypothetical protein ENH90_00530 [bacterium]|nr:hypothetical protein [bacterium]